MTGDIPSATAFLSRPEAVAAALARLEAEDAVNLPLLDDAACAPLIAATDALTYRRARPVVGPEERQVHQDFDICMNPARPTPFHDLAEALERLLATKGLLANAELNHRVREFAARPHGHEHDHD